MNGIIRKIASLKRSYLRYLIVMKEPQNQFDRPDSCISERESSDETFYRRKIKEHLPLIKNYILLIYDGNETINLSYYK